jgi:hypothetical protein
MIKKLLEGKISNNDLEKIGKEIIKILKNDDCEVTGQSYFAFGGYIYVERKINPGALYGLVDLMKKYDNLSIDIRKPDGECKIAVFFMNTDVEE